MEISQSEKKEILQLIKNGDLIGAIEKYPDEMEKAKFGHEYHSIVKYSFRVDTKGKVILSPEGFLVLMARLKMSILQSI